MDESALQMRYKKFTKDLKYNLSYLCQLGSKDFVSEFVFSSLKDKIIVDVLVRPIVSLTF